MMEGWRSWARGQPLGPGALPRPGAPGARGPGTNQSVPMPEVGSNGGTDLLLLRLNPFVKLMGFILEMGQHGLEGHVVN